jgi:hypothetical protein
MTFRASFERHRDDLNVRYPSAVEEIRLIHTDLIKIGQLIRSSSTSNVNRAVSKPMLTSYGGCTPPFPGR